MISIEKNDKIIFLLRQHASYSEICKEVHSDKRTVIRIKKQTRALDLFAGCGGMSLGFENAGFIVTDAVELWHSAAETYRQNFPHTKIHEGDIREIKKQLFADYKHGYFYLIFGGPPCQAYSLAGNRDPNDPRGELYKEFFDIIQYFKPQIFVMENVKGIISMRKDSTLLVKNIQELALSFGYSTDWRILNASDYGVPQERERFFLIGLLNSKNKIFPLNEKYQLQSTVFDAIDYLKNEPENKEWSHIFTKHKPAFIERIKKVKPGENLYEDFSDAWYRLRPDEPARTIKENHGGVFLHYDPDINRCITPREMAELQTFPRNFLFKGSKSDVLKQIGNAVPPQLAKVVALEIKKRILKLGSKYGKQD